MVGAAGLAALLAVAGCAHPDQVADPAQTATSVPSVPTASTASTASAVPTQATSWPPTPSGATRSTTPPLGSGSGRTDATPTAGGTSGNASVPRQAGVVQPVLSALARAAEAQDDNLWAAQLTDRDLGFVGSASMIYHNLGSLRPTRLEFTPTGLQRPVPVGRRGLLGTDAFAAQVLITWQLSGDQRASEHLVWMTFAASTGTAASANPDWQWAGTSDGPAEADPSALPLWWLEPVTVRRSDGNVVLAGPGQDAASWLPRVVRATTTITDRLQSSSHDVPAPDHGWNHHLVLEIASTQSRFEQTVGAPAGSDGALAAVTYPDAMDARLAPMRIMLNPLVMNTESELGVEIVLTHEMTHVATRSPASPAPLWLVEGFADFNAYASFPQAQAPARDLLYRAVRADGAPSQPPGNERFTAQAQNLNLAYAQAWQLCAYLASHGGQGKLNAFYSSVSASPDADVDAALKTGYGFDQAELMKRWDKAVTAAAKG